jgi:ssDNA-binding Zn-finger/Zn-ribbon topoisomerase 1
VEIIIVIALIFVLVLFFITKLKSSQSSAKSGHSYRKLGALFTPAERSFFGVLQQALATDNVLIFGKVRVADVITPGKGMTKSEWQTAFNKISAKHFDFILCNQDDLSVICAIELDDSSHNNAKRKSRDQFLECACESAHFPLIRVPAKQAYSIESIRLSLQGVLSNDETEMPSFGIESADKHCPKCTSNMVLKVAKKGKSVGNEFWGCSSFPKCRHIEQKISK